jgi:hypothetical protein
MGLVGEDESAWGEVSVSGQKDSVQHGFVEEEVTHPFRDDDVDLINWQLNVLQLSLNEGDLVVHSIHMYNFARLLNDSRHVDGIDVLSTCLDGKPTIQLGSMPGKNSTQKRVAIVETYMERIEVPHPTSNTTLSLKRCLFW